MTTSVIPFQGLREGVAALRVPRGLLFHDAHRWKLYLVPDNKEPEKVFGWLVANGLTAGAPVPKEVPRISQVFLVGRDEAPAGGFQALGEARFACSCCGVSCRSLNLGPLLPADVERLQGLDWSGTAHDPARFFITRDGEPLAPEDLRDGVPFLRREGGGCQFLGKDNLCEVHVRFGAAAKPHMCRAFPLYLRATPTGVVVALRLDECNEAEKAMAGAPIAADAGALGALWSELRRVTMLPPQIWLAKGKLLRWDEYDSIERGLLEGTVQPGFAGEGQGGGIAFLLRALQTFASHGSIALPQPAPLDELTALRSWALKPALLPATGLPLARATAVDLDESALRLELHLGRLLLFNKDALQHMNLLLGLGQLAIKVWLTRQRALELAGAAGCVLATSRHLNDAAKELAQSSLRGELADRKLDPVALALAVAALTRLI